MLLKGNLKLFGVLLKLDEILAQVTSGLQHATLGNERTERCLALTRSNDMLVSIVLDHDDGIVSIDTKVILASLSHVGMVLDGFESLVTTLEVCLSEQTLADFFGKAVELSERREGILNFVKILVSLLDEET